MKIEADWDLCDGNGVCAQEAPAYFELDDNDELQIRSEQVAPGDEAAVRRAVDGCPKHALELAD